MENIKKVIVSFNDDKRIKKIIAVFNDEIICSGDNKTEEELNKIYLSCVAELMKSHAEELTGLNNNEILNKLAKLKLLERNDNVIVHMTEYENPIKFIISYDDREVEITENNNAEEYINKYNKYVDEICDTYGIKANNYVEKISALKKLGLYRQYEDKKLLPMILEENKVSNLSVRKRWMLGLLGTGILALITYGGIKLLKENHKANNSEQPTIGLKVIEEPIPTPYVEEGREEPFILFEENTIEPTAVPTPMPTTVPTVEPTAVPTPYIPTATPYEPQYSKNIYFMYEDSSFPGYEEPSDESVLIREVNGESCYGSNYTVEDLIEIRNQNMDSIANNIQSNIPINDRGYYIYYENLFNHNIIDKAYVKYFSMIGNQIIKSGYVEHNQQMINNNSKIACAELLCRIRDDNQIYVYIDGKLREIHYSELSREAKEVVLNIAWSNYTVLNSSPDLYKISDYNEEANITEIIYNGVEYTKSDLADIMIELYDKLSMVK